MANTRAVQDEVIDLYEVLEVSPIATLNELMQAGRRKVQEIANPDSGLSLSDRARTHDLVKIAMIVLVDRLESRIGYDISRMMSRGELALDQIPVPRQDYPSADIAKLRFKMVWRTLRKTLHALLVAYDIAMEEHVLERGGDRKRFVKCKRVDEMDLALDQMYIFVAHVTLDLRKSHRAMMLIDRMGDSAWAQGIRDPRVDAETGKPTLARRTLKLLQVMEEQKRKRFTLQIARALVKVDSYIERFQYEGKVLKILSHLKY
ncbi:hypothetical protein V8F06_006210 [Rhypophila decipiens]